MYYRVRATHFNQVWSLLSGRGIFFPDFVAASVPVTISKCEIKSFGIRVKLLVRGLDLYPDLVEAKCAPLDTRVENPMHELETVVAAVSDSRRRSRLR